MEDRKCNNCGKLYKSQNRTSKYCSIKCSKFGKNNPNWVGDDVSYNSLHTWINTHLQKPKHCECCNKEKRLDAANISGEYKREFSDWEWLCRKCHMTKDGRLGKMIENNNLGRVLPNYECPTCKTIFRPNHSKVKYCSRSCYFKDRFKKNKNI